MDKKYQYGTKENKAFLRKVRTDLFAFGALFAAPGGSAYYLGDDRMPLTGDPRRTYETARMALVYAIGSMIGRPGDWELANRACTGLMEELYDAEHGGWYTGLKPDGSLLPDKLCNVHAYVILAGLALHLADIDYSESLQDDAIDDYNEHFWLEKDGMAADKWDISFKNLSPYRGLNSNLHSAEAFLSAADALGQESYRERAGRIIERVLGWAKENVWRIPEHFSELWVPDREYNRDRPGDRFKPYGLMPGHSIECARMIVQWAVSTYKGREDEKLSTYIEAAENLFNKAFEDAWNCDGAEGFVYTVDWNGKPIVHERMHWVLAEAINTSAVLYKVTGKEIYAERYAVFMQYLDDYVIDHIHGSWFHELDRSNHVSARVWQGKPDLFSAVQATMVPYMDPAVSISRGVAAGSDPLA